MAYIWLFSAFVCILRLAYVCDRMAWRIEKLEANQHERGEEK